MSESTLVMGQSGSGKTTSLRNLNPKTTMVFSVLGKKLPFPKSQKNYTIWSKDNNPEGNVIVTSSAKVVAQWLKHISDKMLHVKTIVVDDNTFLAAKELDKRREEKTYDKFNDIAHEFLYLSELANTLRDDLKIYFLHHTKEDGDGLLEAKSTKAMSYGKMIDDKLGSIEAQFDVVLLAVKRVNEDNKIEYKFKTRDATGTAKTPMGMFADDYIDNDLELVNNAFDCYYKGDCEEEERKIVKVKETVESK